GLHVLPRAAPGYGDRHARRPGLHVLPGPAHWCGHDSDSLDHVPDTGRSRRERARNWLRPPECPEGPEPGVGSRVDEPADPRVHEADHEPDVRPDRKRSVE